MLRRTLLSWLFIALAATSLSACGGSDSSTSTPAHLRLVNATGVDALKLTADTTTINSGISNGTASSYASIDADTYSVFVSATDGSLATSATASYALTADDYYTVVAYARGGQIKLLAITDDVDTPATNFASLTIANAGSDAGALDVYIVTPGSSISDLTPTFSNVSAAGTSLTNSVSAGTYDIIVTAYNKPADVRLTMSSVTLSSLQIATLALTSTTGGALVNGVLVEQKGAVTLYQSNKARVRVAAAFSASGSSNAVVATTVAGSALASVTAPSIGAYNLVPANASEYTISVAGNAVSALALPDAIFASGGDYTILVYGTDTSDAAVSVFTDNNQLPSSGAKIRLINGAVSTGGLSLSASYVPLFSEITYGESSGYLGITTGSTLLKLTSPVSAFTSYSTTVSITSGSVYSLFVLGSTSDALEILSKDK